MNSDQQKAAVALGAGVAGAVLIHKLNARNAAALGVPPLLIVALVALLSHLLA